MTMPHDPPQNTTNSVISDNMSSQPNNTTRLYMPVSFSAKEDIPPITLGIVVVLANVLVLFLVATKKQLRTITNLLLCSLAISDLLTGLVSVPLFMTCNILRHPAHCIAADQMLRFTSVSIVCHLVAVSLDRYVAIIHSLRYKSIVTLPRCASVILFIWILSAAMALTQLSWIDPVHHDVYQESTADILKKEMVYDVISLAVLFFAPLICMVFVYAKIYSEVSRQINNIQKQCTPGWQKAREIKNGERKAVMIFAVMLLVHTICWLPYFILRCIYQRADLHPLFGYITTWLRFLTSFLNPCLYTFGKKDFREALKWRKTQKEQFRNLLPLNQLKASVRHN